jgi:hypothetical protein
MNIFWEKESDTIIINDDNVIGNEEAMGTSSGVSTYSISIHN